MNEVSYLNFVIDTLRQKIKEIDAKMEENQEDIESMNDYFWENYTEFDEYGYELYDNGNAIKGRLREQDDYKRERLRYERMLDSPYFGRVDFCYEGEQDAETYYIGIGNLAKDRASNPYVCDWRAPVAGLFYDYDKGPAEFLAPAGIFYGEIKRKKQYKIKRGTIVYILENDQNIDDEILQQSLLEHADASLKSIVNTIQREQNRIIRDKEHRILAVQGCAGSGKTSVALHRIAYLLYHNRKNLSAAQVLILSPNSIFSDYISRILPELGEENIREMTFDDFAYHSLKEYGEAEDRYDEIEKRLHEGEPEYYFTQRGLKPATKEADEKQTKPYVEELNGFVLSLEWELMRFGDFSYRKIAIKETELLKMFYETFADVPILSRMEKIGEYLIDAEETLRGKSLLDEEKQEIFNRLDLMYETKNLIELYNRFLSQSGREALDCSDNKLRYEDVYPLLYLKYALKEPPKGREVRHLVIDEMQDYSYLQYVLLEKMFHCPMTILGDKVQTMAAQRQDVLSFLPKIFGKDVYCVSLNKGYRSTVEIMEFANQLVLEEGAQQINRHGEAPQIKRAQTREEMLRMVADDLAGETDADMIAVLCLDADHAKEIAEKLKGATLLKKDSIRFSKGISVMPFYLAKGLEFDAVYVPDLQAYLGSLHKQALYINATRALHVLRLYEVQNHI